MTFLQRKSFVFALAGFALGGCARAVSTGRFNDVTAGGEPLRSAFNGDEGRVRIVMLVSPT